MKNKNQTIDELVEDFCSYLRSVKRADSTINLYNLVWRRIKAFMSSHNIQVYDESVGERFLTAELGNYDYSELKAGGKHLVNRVEALYEFQCTGRIVLGIGLPRRVKKVFNGEIGLVITDYINYKKSGLGLQKATLTNYIIYLHDFLVFLQENGVKSLNEINASFILSFIKKLDPHKMAAKHVALGILRRFFVYLFEEQFLSDDYSKIIPQDNYKKQPKLPSVFSSDEVKMLLRSVDRANGRGKRDYAILLLATKLGLRSSDIAALKFENVIWEKNVLRFTQLKTGKDITLPLLPEIGNAIIDYLKFGRPASDLPDCFLQHLPPHEKIVPKNVGQLVDKYISRAGINVLNRRHGAHALRHSFAANLLENKTMLPVISEALGHTKTDSTMYYLRIDVNQLKQCALEVVPVPSSFYNQKGGLIS